MTDPHVKNSRRQMTIMFALGLVPMLVAYVAYNHFPQLLSASTTNVGTFILPPMQANEALVDTLDEQWALLLPLIGTCDVNCERRFYLAGQVDLALGKESERLGRILVADQSLDAKVINQFMAAYAGMRLQRIDTRALKDALKQVTGGSMQKTPAGVMIDQYIFLMDPIGNIMMFYSVDQAGKGMFKDIKHLLKVSNIG